MKNVTASGWHLIVDGVVRDPATIDNPTTLCDFMRKLVDVLEMQILSGPDALDVPLDPAALATDDDEGGITGFCVITTSHIAIHTWPLRRKFSMDVFSCKPFVCREAFDFIARHLGLEAASVTWIDRTWPAGGASRVESFTYSDPAADEQPASRAA